MTVNQNQASETHLPANPEAATPEAPVLGLSGGPPLDGFNIPKAVLLAKRRQLEACRKRFGQATTEQPAALMSQPSQTMCNAFESAMYPATMGPEQFADRMGYGEQMSENREHPPNQTARQLLRTRSGSLPLGIGAPEQPLLAAVYASQPPTTSAALEPPTMPPPSRVTLVPGEPDREKSEP
jgi:hypothetical protein